MHSLLLLLLVVLCVPIAHCGGGTHTSNWAVIVDTSRYWFNYRHISNALSLYRTVKSMGIPDSQIILMLADDMPCNTRNSYQAQMFGNRKHSINLYSEDIEVDYRGMDCNVENILRVLTGRHHPDTPASKRLPTDEHANVLIYMSGHGGDQFLKFHDKEEIQSQDLADAFEQMHKQKRYNEILFMVDTCQAATLYEEFYSPSIIAIGSSRRNENSYSHEHDMSLGVSVIDRFTYAALEFFERANRNGKLSKTTVNDLFVSFSPQQLRSVAAWDTFAMSRGLDEIPLTDFFGSVIEASPNSYSKSLLNVTYIHNRESKTTAGLDDILKTEASSEIPEAEQAPRETSSAFTPFTELDNDNHQQHQHHVDSPSMFRSLMYGAVLIALTSTLYAREKSQSSLQSNFT